MDVPRSVLRLEVQPLSLASAGRRPVFSTDLDECQVAHVDMSSAGEPIRAVGTIRTGLHSRAKSQRACVDVPWRRETAHRLGLACESNSENPVRVAAALPRAALRSAAPDSGSSDSALWRFDRASIPDRHTHEISFGGRSLSLRARASIAAPYGESRRPSSQRGRLARSCGMFTCVPSSASRSVQFMERTAQGSQPCQTGRALRRDRCAFPHAESRRGFQWWASRCKRLNAG